MSAGGAKFRSRKIDYRKALHVFRASELPDIDEVSSHRSVPIIATGVEKEEEEEHHLQEALHAAQTNFGKAQVFIPVPDASREFPDFALFYIPGYTIPKSYIRTSAQMDDLMGCPYNTDLKDDDWLAAFDSKTKSGELAVECHIDINQFEWIMWALEKTTSEQLPGLWATEADLEQFLQIEQPGVAAQCRPAFPHVYQYWHQRRVVERDGLPIHPSLITEEGLKAEGDPYVCFRRREVRQLRKTRKLDNQSLEKLKMLRAELERARELMNLVARRELLRKESLKLEHLVFQSRTLVRRMRKKLGIIARSEREEESPSRKRKKSHKDIGMVKLAFSRVAPSSESADSKARLRKEEDEAAGWEDFTDTPFVPIASGGGRAEAYWDKDVLLSSSAIPVDLSKPNLIVESTASNFSRPYRMEFARRRIGRGGRIIFDRHVSYRGLARHDNDDDSGLGDFDFILQENSDSPRRKRRKLGGIFDGSSDDASGSDDEAGATWNDARLSYWLERWKYDNSDDEIEETHLELRNNSRTIAQRSILLADIYRQNDYHQSAIENHSRYWEKKKALGRADAEGLRKTVESSKLPTASNWQSYQHTMPSSVNGSRESLGGMGSVQGILGQGLTDQHGGSSGQDILNSVNANFATDAILSSSPQTNGISKRKGKDKKSSKGSDEYDDSSFTSQTSPHQNGLGIPSPQLSAYQVPTGMSPILGNEASAEALAILAANSGNISGIGGGQSTNPALAATFNGMMNGGAGGNSTSLQQQQQQQQLQMAALLRQAQIQQLPPHQRQQLLQQQQAQSRAMMMNPQQLVAYQRQMMGLYHQQLMAMNARGGVAAATAQMLGISVSQVTPQHIALVRQRLQQLGVGFNMDESGSNGAGAADGN